MFRFIVVLLTSIFLITILRSVMGILLRGVSEFMRAANPSTPPPAGQPNRVPEIPHTDELKKDPVCGTFVAAATSVKQAVGGDTFYFCSTACRDKFRR